MEFEITEPETEDELAQAFHLRYERLRKPHGLPEGSERDPELEDFSIQMIVKSGDRVIAAGAWIAAPSRTGLKARFRQIAVDPAYEGVGIGSAIVEHAAEQARALGATELRSMVRDETVDFYRRLGWVVVGERMELFGRIPSVSMVKHLS